MGEEIAEGEESAAGGALGGEGVLFEQLIVYLRHR